MEGIFNKGLRKVLYNQLPLGVATPVIFRQIAESVSPLNLTHLDLHNKHA